MQNIVNKYSIDDIGQTSLIRLANILKIHNTKTADIPYNLLITYDDEHEVRSFSEDLARYIASHSERRHAYLYSEAELDDTDVLKTRSKNAAAYFIFADSKHTLEQRKNFGELVQYMLPIIFAFCISTAECERAFKSDDHLYYRIFSEHIHISSANPQIITARFLSDLEGRGFETTEIFAQNISDYISTVYPKADLKNEAFIRDLARRVINNHYGSGNESNLMEDNSVPYYVKPTDSDTYAPSSDYHLIAIPKKDTQQSLPSPQVSTSISDAENIDSDDFNEELPAKGCKHAKTCNIMLLSLSFLYSEYSESTYYYNNIKGGNYIYQLEPVVRMLSKQLMDSTPSDCLDHLVMLCTSETTDTKKNIKLPNETIKQNTTALNFFKERVKDYLNPDLGDKELFIKQEVSEDAPSKAIRETVDKLRELKNSIPSGTKIQLFVDRHGGFRGFQQSLDAILSLLRDEFPLIEIYDVRYTKPIGIIVKLNHRSIFDFVSGVNEFTNYGRIDSLIRYYDKDMPIIMKNIMSIANSIQLCDIYGFEKGLDDLTQYFKNPVSDTEFLSIFEEAIQADYHDLITNHRTTIAEIEWCIRKGFFQQALTLIEGAMPRELYECGVISYHNELVKKVTACKQQYEENTYIFNHSIPYMVPRYIRNDLLKNKKYNETSIGTLFCRNANTSYGKNLISNTVFNDKDVSVDNKYSHINFKVDDINQFYTFIALHCTLKDLRNASNHGAGKPYPISLENLIEALNRYIQLAKDIEEYAQK